MFADGGHFSPTCPGLEDDSRLTVSIPCEQCGYDLRTQPLDGRCPECGTPVARSIHQGDLRLATQPQPARITGWLDVTVWALGLFAVLSACTLLAELAFLALLADDNLLGGKLIRSEQAFWATVFYAWGAVFIGCVAALVSVPLVFACLWMLARAADPPALAAQAAAARFRLLLALPLVVAAPVAVIFADWDVRLVIVLAAAGAVVACLVPIARALAGLWGALGQRHRCRAASATAWMTSLLAAMLIISAGWRLLDETMSRPDFTQRVGLALDMATAVLSLPACGAMVILAYSARRLRKTLRRLPAAGRAPEPTDG